MDTNDIYKELINGRWLTMRPSDYAEEYLVVWGYYIVATISLEKGGLWNRCYRVCEWAPDQEGDFGFYYIRSLDDVWRRVVLYAKYQFVPAIIPE